MLLLIDHRDSFTYNLAQALAVAGAEVRVLDAHSTKADEVAAARPSHVLLGPGPGHPERATLARELCLEPPPGAAVLGVCLGHQALGLAFGARVVRSEPVHGHASPVQHDGRGLFRGCPQPLEAGRYHSLSIDPESLPAQLEPCASTENGILMGVRHRSRPLAGVQFHPESILSMGAAGLLANFLQGALFG